MHDFRRFDVVDTHNLPPMTTAFINFVKSKYMCSYFESITNYTLQKENDCKCNFLENFYFFLT